MTRDPSRAWYAAAGALAVVGLLVRVTPAPVPDGAPPAAAPDTTPGSAAEPEQARALLGFEEIVRANVFSEDRSPPRARYLPPGFEAPTPARRGPDVRLLGIATGPTGAVALIDADPVFPGAENYRVGDQVGDARLTAIDDSSVVLEAPGGRRVLRLPSATRRVP